MAPKSPLALAPLGAAIVVGVLAGSFIPPALTARGLASIEAPPALQTRDAAVALPGPVVLRLASYAPERSEVDRQSIRRVTRSNGKPGLQMTATATLEERVTVSWQEASGLFAQGTPLEAAPPELPDSDLKVTISTSGIVSFSSTVPGGSAGWRIRKSERSPLAPLDIKWSTTMPDGNDPPGRHLRLWISGDHVLMQPVPGGNVIGIRNDDGSLSFRLGAE